MLWEGVEKEGQRTLKNASTRSKFSAKGLNSPKNYLPWRYLGCSTRSVPFVTKRSRTSGRWLPARTCSIPSAFTSGWRRAALAPLTGRRPLVTNPASVLNCLRSLTLIIDTIYLSSPIMHQIPKDFKRKTGTAVVLACLDIKGIFSGKVWPGE